MKIEYTKQDDYLLPDLELKKDDNYYSFGRYGRLRLNYLKENKKIEYQKLLMSDELTKHLSYTDKTANERLKNIIDILAEKENVNEELKATDQMKWVGLVNNFKSQAEEIVLSELIYFSL